MHPQKKENEKRNEPRPCSKRSTSAAKQTKRSLYTCLRLRESGAKREKGEGGGVAWRQFAAEHSVWLLPQGGGRNSKDFFFNE